MKNALYTDCIAYLILPISSKKVNGKGEYFRGVQPFAGPEVAPHPKDALVIAAKMFYNII